MISKLSGLFQMTANFPDDFKTVRIFQMTANDIHYVFFGNVVRGKSAIGEENVAKGTTDPRVECF